MTGLLNRTCLWLVIACLLLAPGASAHERHADATKHEHGKAQPAGYDGPKEDLHIYLLIGQSNMAGRATIPEDMAGVIDRCYLLNDKNQWVPAKNPLNLYSTIRKGQGMQKLGPGYGFALKMRKEDPDLRLGLVVNARGGSTIDQWGPDTRYYKQSLERTRAAMKTGTLKGVLWHQGESDSGKPKSYLGKLKTLVANLRGDLGDKGLPFVAGQIMNKPALAINDEITKLPDAVKHTAVASSEGLTCTDRWHFDTESQLLLGKRYAERIIELLDKEDRAK